MKRVVIVGGHGKVALIAAPLLVADGCHVTAWIRTADQSGDVASTGAEPLVADVERLGTHELTDLLRGEDVVIWSAGAGGGDPDRTYAVDRDAAKRTMDAASAAGARRFVMVSYFGAGPHHGVPAGHSFHAYAEAKAAADAHLQASGLEWTILRPSRLTLDAPTGAIEVGAARGSHVSRGNVAGVIRAVVAADTSDVARAIIAFNDGVTPIDEAVAQAGASGEPGG